MMTFKVYDKNTKEPINYTDFALDENGVLYDRDDMCEFFKQGNFIIRVCVNNECSEFEY